MIVFHWKVTFADGYWFRLIAQDAGAAISKAQRLWREDHRSDGEPEIALLENESIKNSVRVLAISGNEDIR